MQSFRVAYFRHFNLVDLVNLNEQVILSMASVFPSKNRNSKSRLMNGNELMTIVEKLST